MTALDLGRRAALAALLCVCVPAAEADVFLANHGGGAGIYRYDDAGTFLGKHATGGRPLGLSFGPDGGLYFHRYLTETTLRIDPVSGVASVFVSGGYPLPPNVHQITFGGPGNDLYVAAPGAGAVVRFDGATGAFEALVDIAGDTQTIGVAVDASGVVYASSRTGRIRKYESGILSSFATAPSGWFEALTIGSDGNLYAGSSGSRIYRYKPDGTPFGAGGSTSDPTFIDDSRLDNAFSPSFGPDGNLYVVSFNTSQVLRYGPDGTFIDTFLGSTPGLDRPTYLAFGTFAPPPVPEPAPIALLISGIAVLTLTGRKRMNAKLLRGRSMRPVRPGAS